VVTVNTGDGVGFYARSSIAYDVILIRVLSRIRVDGFTFAQVFAIPPLHNHT